MAARVAIALRRVSSSVDAIFVLLAIFLLHSGKPHHRLPPFPASRTQRTGTLVLHRRSRVAGVYDRQSDNDADQKHDPKPRFYRDTLPERFPTINGRCRSVILLERQARPRRKRREEI